MNGAVCIYLAFLCIALLTGVVPARAAHIHQEKVYQAAWCAQAGGITEYLLDDGARVDCLTDEYAIEFDFGPKWAESIGQALYYGIRTGRKPGVVLILENEHPQFERRLLTVVTFYGISVWIVRSEESKQERRPFTVTLAIM